MVEERVLGGRYRLQRRIAGGGMGTVYEAFDQRLDRQVAVKVLNPQLADDESFVERFRREARSVAGLSHQNIATLFDYGEDSGEHFIVMELIEGRDLSRVMREEGPLPPERAAAFVAQICDGLHHAHAAGVVHRDVKPANVLVSDGDRVHVTDFGIARAGGDAKLTRTGTVFGSAHYLSPEQASGGTTTPVSDVYSAGIVLYELLTGALPFTGDSPVAVAMRHMSEPVPAPSEVNSEIPEQFDAIVARATAKDPADRFESAAAMAAALRGDEDATTALAGAGVTATRPLTAATPVAATAGAPPSAGPPASPWRRLAFLVAGIILLVVLGVLLANAMGDDEAPAGRTEGAASPRRERAQRTEQPAVAPTTAPAPEGVTIPDVAGMEASAAEERLKGEGFGVERREEDSDQPKDTALRTEPGAGETAPSGSVVTLVVSNGSGFTEEEEVDEEDEEDSEEEGDAGLPVDIPGNGKAKGKDKDKDK